MAAAFLSDDDVGLGGGAGGGNNAPGVSYMSDANVGIAPPTPPSAVASDVAKSAASGAVRGVVGAPLALPSVGATIANALGDGGDWLVRKALGLSPQTDADRAHMAEIRAKLSQAPFGLPNDDPVAIGASMQTALDPYLHTPQTTAGKYAESVGEMAPMVAANPETLATMGTKAAVPAIASHVVAPAVASEAAGEAAQGTPYEGVARLAGGIAGGAALHTAGAIGDAVTHSAPVAGALDKVGIAGPAQTRAAKQFINTATDPAAVREALANPANPTGEAGTQFSSISAPGADGTPVFAQPSTGELTQDPGLMIAQRGDMAKNTAAYLPQMADANAARVGAFQTDVGTSPLALANHVQSQAEAIHDHWDAQAQASRDSGAANVANAQDAAQGNIAFTDAITQAQLDRARTAQTNATAPIQATAPEVLGEQARGALNEQNNAAKAQEGSLYRAVDPNNELVASTAPINEAVKSTYANMSPTAQAFISPAEKTFLNLVDNYPGRVSYQEAGDLSSQLAAAMRQERASNQGITPAYRRMSMLMDGVKKSLNDTVQRRVAADADAVSTGQMAPEDTTAARIQRWQLGDATDDANGTAQRSGTGDSDLSSGAAPVPPSLSGAAPTQDGRPSQGSGNPNLPLPPDEVPRVVTPAQGGRPPQSLVSFVQRMGGVNDARGDLRAAGMDRHPGLITRNGIGLDHAREAAAEAGYLGADTEHAVANTDVNDFIDALNNHPHYSVHDSDAVALREQRAKEVAHQKDFAAARKSLRDTLTNEHGLSASEINDRLLNRGAYNMLDGHGPLDAYDLAARQNMAQHEARMTALRNEGMPEERGFDFDGEFAGEDRGPAQGGPSGAENGDANPSGAGAGGSSGRGEEPARGSQNARARGVTYEPSPETAARKLAANRATIERNSTFGKGAVGEVLHSGPTQGTFKISDAQVPGKLFRAGPAGGDAVRGYLKAVGDRPEAISAMHDMATSELARTIEKKNGVLTQADLDRFKGKFKGALTAIDAHTPGFTSRFDTAARATRAVELAEGQRQSALTSAQAEGKQRVKAAQAEADQHLKATTAEGRDAAKAYQQGIVKNLIESRDSGSVVAHLKSMLADPKRGAAEADRLAAAVEGNEAAQASLRNALSQAFSEHIQSGNRVAGSKVGLIKDGATEIFDKLHPILSRFLPADHLENMRKITEGADQLSTQLKGTRLPYGSNTTQDSHASGLHKGHGVAATGGLGALLFLAYEHGGEHLINEVPMGAKVAAGATIAYRVLRNMGIKSTEKYMGEMLRNPEFAAQLIKRVSPTYDSRQNRITGLIRKALLRGGKPSDDDTPPDVPPNEPPPSGPFSRDRQQTSPPLTGPSSEGIDGRVDQNGSANAKVAQSPNIPLTGAQARTLRAAGYNALDIRGMSSADRAAALKQAMDAGVAPSGRLSAQDRAAMGGALPHDEHAGRTGDGRFARSGDILSHPDINGRIEPTFHPDADATHQAILAHEARLNAIASQLKPDASVKDIASTAKGAANDVQAMMEAYHGTNRDFDKFDSRAASSKAARSPFEEGVSFFTDDKNAASGYGNRVLKAKIDLGKTDTYDATHLYNNDPSFLEKIAAATREENADRDPDAAEMHVRNQHQQYMNNLAYKRQAIQSEIDRMTPEERADFPHDINELMKPDAVGNASGVRAAIMREARERGLDTVRIKNLNDGGKYDQIAVLNHKSIKSLDDNGKLLDVLAKPQSAEEAPTSPAGQGVTLTNPRTGATARAQSTMTLSDALDRFDVSNNPQTNNLQRASHLAVGERLSNLVGNVPVHTVGRAEMRVLAQNRMNLAPGQDPSGFYDPKTHSIIAMDSAMRDPQAASHLMMHEGLHAAFMRVINDSESARNIIDHLRVTALAQHFERGGEQTDHYGFTNAHEFMSEAMSNPKFQQFLSSLPADDRMVRAFGLQSTGRTMWDAFVGAMRRILGVPAAQHTYLDAAMKTGDHLFNMAEIRGLDRTNGDAKPIISAYHTTRGDQFDKFDNTKIGSATDAGLLGKGHYFTTDPSTMKRDRYLKNVDLDMQNPLQLESHNWADNKTELVTKALGISRDSSPEKITEAAKKAGYDGVTLDYSHLGYRHQEHVIFDGSQAKIKSVRDLSA